jgi:GTP-binding protein HflX
VLVQLDFGQNDLAERAEEARLLIESAGGTVAAQVGGKRETPDPKLFAGKGKVEEIAAAMQAAGASCAVFNHTLSAVQERNLERALTGRIVDRTRLILDIFARRAQSAEGRLQVELAQLEYASTRLVRSWTHLERQRGGFGFVGGPGETQIELDRRLIGERVKRLKERLKKLTRQRQTQRKARRKGGALTVSFVGYTNAGKSTLFNALTHAGVYAADQLFATLDASTKKVWLADDAADVQEKESEAYTGGASVILSDTVGFIRDLPHALVAAFHATLEAVAEADLLLHVVDWASPAREEQMAAVNTVLAEIGAQHVPQLLIANKADLTGMPPALLKDPCGTIRRLCLSAKTGAGLDLLRTALLDFSRAKQRNLNSMPESVSDSVFY